jgi:signal transduction histidine kinase
LPLPFLRSLRSRLLLLFAALAVGPLATVGLLDYARSRRMIRALIVAQTGTLARRAAAIVADRYAVVRSDILLISENAEVQQLFRELARGDSSAIRGAQRAADDYLQEVWRLAGASYSTAELTDARGVRLWSAGRDASSLDSADRLLTINEPVRDLESNRVVGALALAPRPTALWPRDLFAPSFGRSGYGVVIDRPSSRVLLQPNSSVVGMSVRDLVGAAWNEDSVRVSRGSGTLVYAAHDSVRVASYVSLDSPPWTVLSSTALDEFAEPFVRAHRFNLVVLGVLIGVVAVLFVIFIGRATRSLEELTRAAAAVGRGDLSPTLPRAGPDEVGTLSDAFADMTKRVRSMMREIEVSRQLAVLGEFAAQLSHEVRNPLTSLKLDLQGLQRQVRSGALPPSAEAPVASSLREVNRLDTVVRGVLELARQSGAGHRPFCLDEVIDHSVAALRAQLEQRNVAVERPQHRESTQLIGDPELLSGMLMNLLINAAEAQPHGGRVGVSSVTRRAGDGGEWVDVTIADDGPGVAADLRHDVFRPFYTSRHDGTGLGLALALRTARDHGGHIACDAAADGFRGAAFIVSLPIPLA